MVFDVVTNSEKVPGRPSPFMVFDCMLEAYKLTKKVFPVEAVVKIDDTAAGICGNTPAAGQLAFMPGSNDYDQLAAAKPGLSLCPRLNMYPKLYSDKSSRAAPRERPGQGAY